VARQKAILLYLPDFMDLLTISVDAGLDFLTAMNRVVEKQPDGPLRDEMIRFFKQLELGRSRREGLRELADRVQLKDLSNVCAALIQADRLGSSIGPVLQAQSDMLRTQRGQRAEKAALEAPVKMMAPLLCCIFPAVFIMILAPVGIQIMIDRGVIQP
jgi:tight adherence protein C